MSHDPAPQIDSQVHHAYVDGLRRTGKAPHRDDVAFRLGLATPDVEQSLLRLAAGHGVVLHPHVCEPWVIHPFSTSPTATWVQGPEHGWWAPCIWCGLGVATLVGGTATLHTRYGGESREVCIHVQDGRAVEEAILVHFAVAPRFAWDNVHHFCATVLPFEGDAEVDAWSHRHGLPRGEAVPIAQVMRLASRWYGRHGDRDWRKWTAAEARQIFDEVGLNGQFWQITPSEGRF